MPSDPLAWRHPILQRLRRVDSWWTLARALDGAAIDPAEADAALSALAALDRSWNDTPSADTHEAFRGMVAAALADGVAAAFSRHAARTREAAPERLRPALAEIDRHVLLHLETSEPSHLQDAERAWVDVARSTDIDALPLPLRLSLVCDAALLHQAAFRLAPTPTRLSHVVGMLRVALTLFRHFQAHPPSCALHLDPRLQTITGALAIALRTRFESPDGNHAHLKDALELQARLLHVTHPAAPELPLHLVEYARSLGYQGAAGIEAGTAALMDAAALEPPGSAARRANLALAARGHLAVFETAREPAPLDSAISALETAFAGSAGNRDEGHVRLLAEARLRRAALTSSRADVDAAVGLLSGIARDAPLEPGASPLLDAITPVLPKPDAASVVDAALDALPAYTRPEDAPAVAAHAARLARLLEVYDEGRGLPHVRDRIIRLLDTAQVLDATSIEAGDRFASLAVHLAARFASGGHARDLGRAVDAARQAVAITPAHEEARRREYANALGALLVRRYDLAGATSDIQEAVAAFEWAAQPGLTRGGASTITPTAGVPPGDLERLAGYLGNLGSALRQLSERRRTRDDLDRAIALLEEAAAIAAPLGGAAAARAHNNLGAAYHDRWRRFHGAPDLDAAIEQWSEAERALPVPATQDPVSSQPGGAGLSDVAHMLRRLALRSDEPSRGVLAFNRGNALLSRYERDQSPGDLVESIELLERALPLLDTCSPDRALAANRLATALHLRAQRSGSADDARLSREWSRRALSWASAASSEARFRVAWDWGMRASATGNWADAAEAYAAGLVSLRDLAGASLTLREREWLLAEAFGLPTRAAYAMARAGRLQDAVIALEYGRGLLLADRLGIVDARLETLAGGKHAALLQEYRRAVARWRALADRVSALVADGEPVRWTDIESARRALLESQERLTAASGMEDAFGPPSYAEIAAAAAVQLLYLVPGQDAGIALLVSPGAPGPALVDLPELDEQHVGEQTRAFVDAYLRIAEAPDAWPPALDQLTGWLGAALAPAMAAIGGTRTIVIPTGALAFLPLHAAWVEDARRPTGRRYAIDEAILSYSPGALSLAAARQRSSARDPAASLLAVHGPRPSAEPPLLYAAAEVAMAAAAFAAAERLEGPGATIEHSLARLGHHPVAHFATHARSVLEDPRRSGILHADDRMLTVADLLELDLAGARLAVLSACETGIPGADAPDEVIGIATALFGAGFDGVLASLWPVLDASTLLLITRFYEYWRDGSGVAGDPAAALVLAQRWMRDTTNEEKQAHWNARHAQGLLPEATHRAIAQELAMRPRDARSFASPDDWAPFVFIGI